LFQAAEPRFHEKHGAADRSSQASKRKQQKDITMRHQIMGLAGALALAMAPFTSQALAQAGGASSGNLPFVAKQSTNEFLAGVFIGHAVHNAAGDVVGNINDLAFDQKGHITTVVIGVGGFLGIGEKSVGVPFGALTFKVGKDGQRMVAVALSKQDLTLAPIYEAIDKTTFTRVREQATDLGQKAADKAVEFKNQAAQRIQEIRKSDPIKQ
jgi:sporulation protein YlmC with PRC-barrel domain